jgi:hypothetical protein
MAIVDTPLPRRDIERAGCGVLNDDDVAWNAATLLLDDESISEEESR